MTPPDKRPYLAIARISSEEQAQGFSLEVQETRIREHAQRKGIVLERVFKLIESASISEKRTQFHAILDFARKEARRLGGIMFVSVDRGTRNPEDLLMLLNLEQETGLRVDFLDGDFDAKTALGELFLTMQGTIARFQVRTQAEKIRQNSFDARRDTFLKASKFVIEDLNSTAIDLSRAPTHLPIWQIRPGTVRLVPQ